MAEEEEHISVVLDRVVADIKRNIADKDKERVLDNIHYLEKELAKRELIWNLMNLKNWLVALLMRT